MPYAHLCHCKYCFSFSYNVEIIGVHFDSPNNKLKIIGYLFDTLDVVDILFELDILYVSDL